ncbi:MAG: hypothetical protein IJB52_13795 [Clostridia bacterium]|nr:hypothetical protein [Clostridia bacterium]
MIEILPLIHRTAMTLSGGEAGDGADAGRWSVVQLPQQIHPDPEIRHSHAMYRRAAPSPIPPSVRQTPVCLPGREFFLSFSRKSEKKP